jgi:hypothetical protein
MATADDRFTEVLTLIGTLSGAAGLVLSTLGVLARPETFTTLAWHLGTGALFVFAMGINGYFFAQLQMERRRMNDAQA